MFNLGPAEIIVVLIIALLVFGPKKLPEIGKSVGQGLREFKKASRSILDEIEHIGEDTPVPTYETGEKAIASGEKKEESNV